jgi:hypothetical protein
MACLVKERDGLMAVSLHLRRSKNSSKIMRKSVDFNVCLNCKWFIWLSWMLFHTLLLPSFCSQYILQCRHLEIISWLMSWMELFLILAIVSSTTHSSTQSILSMSF